MKFRLKHIIFCLIIPATSFSQSNFIIPNFNSKGFDFDIQNNMYLAGDNGNAAVLYKISTINSIVFSKSYSSSSHFFDITYYNSYLYVSGININKPNITKLDLNGNVIWSKETPNAENTLFSSFSIQNDTLVFYFVTQDDAKLYCLDTNGTMFWSVNIPTNDVYFLRGDVFKVGANIYYAYVNSLDLCVAKISNSGGLIWNKRYNYNGGFNPIFLNKTIIQNNNSFLINGNLQTDPFIIKMDNNGSIFFAKRIQHVYNNNWAGCISKFNNQYFILGSHDDNSTAWTQHRFYVSNLDTNFNLISQIEIGKWSSVDLTNRSQIKYSNQFEILRSYNVGTIDTTEILRVQNINQIYCDTIHSYSNIIDYNLDTITQSTIINSGLNLVSVTISPTNFSGPLQTKCPMMDIEILSKKEFVLIFPNPNTGNFTIQLPNHEIIKSIKIFNAIGELVFLSSENANEKNICLNEKPGIYFVLIENNKNEFWKSKVIIE